MPGRWSESATDDQKLATAAKRLELQGESNAIRRVVQFLLTSGCESVQTPCVDVDFEVKVDNALMFSGLVFRMTAPLLAVSLLLLILGAFTAWWVHSMQQQAMAPSYPMYAALRFSRNALSPS